MSVGGVFKLENKIDKFDGIYSFKGKLDISSCSPTEKTIDDVCNDCKNGLSNESFISSLLPNYMKTLMNAFEKCEYEIENIPTSTNTISATFIKKK